MIQCTIQEARTRRVKQNVEINIPLNEWPAERLCRCWYCGCPIAKRFLVETAHGRNPVALPEGYVGFHREHQLPRSRGGTGERNNIVGACQTCNNRKGTKTVEEFRLYYATRHSVVPWRPLVPYLFYGEQTSTVQ